MFRELLRNITAIFHGDKIARSLSTTTIGRTTPKAWIEAAYWVNGTPHLTKFAAQFHSSHVRPVSDMEGYELMKSTLKDCDQIESADAYYKSINYDWNKASAMLTTVPHGALVRLNNARERLLKDVDDWSVDPTLGDKHDLQSTLDEVLQWARKLSQNYPILGDFEKKLAVKYASNQNVRTMAGYEETARLNYLPNRNGYRSLKLPKLGAYDEALKIHYGMMASKLDYLGIFSGAMNSTQRNTYGGAPFNIAMDEFADDIVPNNYDKENPASGRNVKYVDIYNFFATVYALLPPQYKERIAMSYQYMPFERIQHGGLTDENNVFAEHKKTKQRVIQAESAVLSHAARQFHDVGLAVWKERVPLTAADKFGEEDVTDAMKGLFIQGQHLASSVNHEVWVAAADWTNYDATQNPILLNDAYYNALRQNFPDWYVYWIIDPYYKVSLSMPTWIPGHGLSHTTGVKSGQQVTNQADSWDANFVDIYECVRHPSWASLPKSEQEVYLSQRLINGDDRLKVTFFGADWIEAADEELGLIAQKSKQEMYNYKDPLATCKVTYLKTLLYYDSRIGSLVRTSSEAADIVGRYTRERVRQKPAPASVVVEAIMSGNRLYEHPDISVLKSFIDKQELGHLWLTKQLSTKQLLNAAAMEELDAMRTNKGKIWLIRSGIDVDSALQRIYNRYGMTPGNYNLASRYTGDDGKLAFEELPLVKRLLAD